MAAKLTVGSIVTYRVEFDKMMPFWREALHYVQTSPDNGWAILRDPEERGPNLSFNRARTKTPGRNSLHLDLYTDDRESEVSGCSR